MLLFTVLGILLIACIVAVIYGDRKYYDVLMGVSAFIGVIDIIVLTVLISELPYERTIKYDIAKYEELKVAVEQVNDNVSYENSHKIVAQSELFEKIYDMNTYIEKNKIYNDSWWFGWLYSEKIAELPLLNYVEKK
jgi:hypothetical protein